MRAVLAEDAKARQRAHESIEGRWVQAGGTGDCLRRLRRAREMICKAQLCRDMKEARAPLRQHHLDEPRMRRQSFAGQDDLPSRLLDELAREPKPLKATFRRGDQTSAK